MDSIQIKGLSVATRIGIYDWEQRIAQKLSIDLTIPMDLIQCQDDINKTLDYDKLCTMVTQYLESNSFKLIETVAESIAQLVKNEFNIKQLTVQVSKPHAIKNANDISVCITR